LERIDDETLDEKKPEEVMKAYYSSVDLKEKLWTDSESYMTYVFYEEKVDFNTAKNTIVTNGEILTNTNIELTAGNSIELNIDFEVEVGAIFHAYIASCN